MQFCTLKTCDDRCLCKICSHNIISRFVSMAPLFFVEKMRILFWLMSLTHLCYYLHALFDMTWVALLIMIIIILFIPLQSSGSGSESGTQTQKSVKSKSLQKSDNNSGSNDEDDNGSVGLNNGNGSDNGSGTQV